MACRAVLAAVAVVFATTAAAAADGASAPPSAHRIARGALPAANFVVEWRIQRAPGNAPAGGIVITSGSAAIGGSSGYGPGAVVVGTAPAVAPQSVRVANGKEASIRFDRSETHLVYDMAFAAQSSSESNSESSGDSGGQAASGGTAATGSGTTTGGGSTSQSRAQSRSQSRAQGVSGHDVTAHRVDGLRVAPRWTRGDTLELDVHLTHAAPDPAGRSGAADSRASRDVDFSSTVQVSIDEWQTVATVGDGGEELQLRVGWR